MSHAEEARLNSLDAVLDSGQSAAETPGELFAIVDALDSQPALRRVLTDPGTPAEGRRSLVQSLFGGKVGPDAVRVLAEASALRWAGGREFTAAIERQAVRAELLRAAGDGQLDDVEDELFRFSRLVQADPALRDALADRSRSVADRQALVGSLLEGKAAPVTLALARRAVAARERNFAGTIEGYLILAAKARQRSIAVVRVARPLQADQAERLRAALTKQIGRQVDLQVIVDPEVLGGIRVELGDEVIEGTISARLEDARQRFR